MSHGNSKSCLHQCSAAILPSVCDLFVGVTFPEKLFDNHRQLFGRNLEGTGTEPSLQTNEVLPASATAESIKTVPLSSVLALKGD